MKYIREIILKIRKMINEKVFQNTALGFISMSIALESKGDNQNKRFFNDDDLRTAVGEELDAFGKTTTLDVKRRIRAKNLFANQDDVSSGIANLMNELGLEFQDNGVYRTYYRTADGLDNQANDVSVDVALTGTVNDPIATQTDNEDLSNITDQVPYDTYTRKDGQKLNAYLGGKQGMWKVNGGLHKTLYFDGKWNRDYVRGAYSSMFKVHSSNVTASKIK